MTERIQKIYERLLARDYRKLRSGAEYGFADKYAATGMSLYLRAGNRLLQLAKAEKAILFEEDKIGMMRTIKKIPPLLTEEEQKKIWAEHFIFDNAQVNNISSDYEKALNMGLEGKRREIEDKLRGAGQGGEVREFYEAMLLSIEAVYLLADKYRVEAEKQGKKELAAALKRVPRERPETYYEALVAMRIFNYALWLNANKHNTLGRFDQYMFPYFENDIKNGRLTREEALELTEEFFLDLNFDSDLYPGIQQGDNGQSMVLGGCDKDGNGAFNELSAICLKASLELKLIDPKINLRVDRNTPEEIYRLGTELTKQGLGFPQYSNDDVVIPALTNWGYELKDARNYVVAACWEFIIPGVAMDIPNVDALNFPKVVLAAVKNELAKAETFEKLMEKVTEYIEKEGERLINGTKNMFMQPSPFQSVLMTDCIERGKDISLGAKYNNYGFHGAGLSTAADSLAAVKTCVYDEKSVGKKELLKALEADFEGFADVRNKLLRAPKMGENNDEADGIAVKLLNDFADSLEGKKNERGGIFRAGTGSAMYYVWYSSEVGATPDGRKKGAPFAANYSPSLDVKFDGVLSVIKSFLKPDLKRVCNGGPLTLEFHDTVFKNEEGTSKVAKLVEIFIKNGGHQLQLNAVNKEKLLDAQKHPEKYPNLIVRVWGWSGYFCELDTVYQNQILKRLNFVC